MVKEIGSSAHPWYKDNHQWKVKGIAELQQPVKYLDRQQGSVIYEPKIMQLESPNGCTALWFNYWISTAKTGGKMKYGGGPLVLEEYTLLELMKEAISNNLFSKDFLKALGKEINNKR
jgi:hypothetical protein